MNVKLYPPCSAHRDFGGQCAWVCGVSCHDDCSRVSAVFASPLPCELGQYHQWDGWIWVEAKKEKVATASCGKARSTVIERASLRATCKSTASFQGTNVSGTG